MQVTGEVVKVPKFLSTTYDGKLPMYTIFVRDKVISNKDHNLEILQNQFNLIF